MHQISPAAIYISKIFPGKKPPDPCLQGRGGKDSYGSGVAIHRAVRCVRTSVRKCTIFDIFDA